MAFGEAPCARPKVAPRSLVGGRSRGLGRRHGRVSGGWIVGACRREEGGRRCRRRRTSRAWISSVAAAPCSSGPPRGARTGPADSRTDARRRRGEIRQPGDDAMVETPHHTTRARGSKGQQARAFTGPSSSLFG
nr:unnamed protein product [Digitaria exilis]